MNTVRSKFRGTLLGGLIGDCFGAPFEVDGLVSISQLKSFLSKSISEGQGLKTYPYTDDSAMTKSLAESLIEHQGFNAVDLAKKFTFEYIKSPKRGYGSNVTKVFAVLKVTDFENPFDPAKKLFCGAGSYGNGAAMRIAPVALFGYNFSDEALINLVENCSRITHSHQNGINGAILQCLSVHCVLRQNITTFKPLEYVDQLLNTMKRIEKNSGSSGYPYTEKLTMIKSLLEKQNDQNIEISSEEIASSLGNQVSAVQSVGTAIFIFLRSLQPLADFETDDAFLRSLYLAISVGGDTDTIASMACNIMGAFLGSDQILPKLIEKCEANEEFLELADKLYNIQQV